MGSSITTLSGQALSIGIEGMTCSSCAARVEKLLARLPGISKATVSFPTESALLESDSVVDLTAIYTKFTNGSGNYATYQLTLNTDRDVVVK